jgi:flagellar protein FlaH
MSVRIISTGNEELDRKLPGGLPYPLLLLIEGGHGTGKTVLTQQFVYGALNQGLRVIVITTETTVKDYLEKMRSIKMDASLFFIKSRFKIFSSQILGVRWTRLTASKVLPILQEWILDKIGIYDVLAIDSLSHLAIYATPSQVMEFFNTIRNIRDKGKMVIITLHEGVLREDLATRARATCDGFFKLGTATVGGKTFKVLNIVKLQGAPMVFDPKISFDVDPAFGIKIVPIALAQA